MLMLLLLVVGCYVLAALLVHLAHWLGRGRVQRSKHYVLITDSGQNNMEWYLRMLHAFSRWMGKDVRLTVVDRGASEETMAIVERWRRGGKEVRVHAQLPDNGADDGKNLDGGRKAAQMMWMLQAEGIVSESEHAVLVDLQNPSDLSKMPF
ncbi:hypothetical protein D3P08_18545 [Paenibacillus nanensis]|uniref:Uncharacterized protein n=1 Tax=Paenibacillus nanensis TaxID=393251 RepID=A0A3A1URA0_9BACL|nr:hypothetical protein [Paenibacillus nanensis]RIX51077.1 hypothetical protein D3P08_18545 [Paenibacillus nanensis]